MSNKVLDVEEVYDLKMKNLFPNNPSNLGLGQMINVLAGLFCMDGYKVTTEQNVFYVLIDNEQSCCESWGYITSDDDLSYFKGAELLEVKLTDTALKQESLKASGFYGDDDEIQFVDFDTDRGTFQLAVYNSHNGYYGHQILVLKDEEVLLNGTL